MWNEGFKGGEDGVDWLNGRELGIEDRFEAELAPERGNVLYNIT